MDTPLFIGDEESRRRALDHIADLDIKGKRWNVTVKRAREQRSLEQNNLMWKWIAEVTKHCIEYTGYEKDEIHDLFKQNLLPAIKSLEMAGLTAKRFTTTTLNTKEMSEYCDRIYRWASAELGLALKLPPSITEEEPANGADDWGIVASDLLVLIEAAPNVGRLDEITSLNTRALNAMEASAPSHYARVMEAVASRGEYLNKPAEELHPLQAG